MTLATSNARLERELEVAKALAKKPRKPRYPTYRQDVKTSLHSCLWCLKVFNRWEVGYGADTFAALEQHVTTRHVEVNSWSGDPICTFDPREA